MSDKNDDEIAKLVRTVEVLAGLPPDVRDFLADALPMPTHLVDQFDAAGAEAQHAVAKSGGTLGCEPMAVPPWAARRALRALLGWALGTATTCEHASAGIRSPMPVVAVAGRPGLVTCRQCVTMLLVDGDATCDRCGITAGEISGVQFSLCNMIFIAGSCADCLTAIEEVDRA